MTEKEWTEEVARALAGAGLPCRVQTVWLERGGAMCYAELIDTRSGKEQTIRLSHQEFTSVAARRAEITRQVEALRQPVSPTRSL